MNTNKLLHFPVLSHKDFIFFRLLGPGFGNLLFPLYRAFQAQKKLGGDLVFPQFFQIKLGPFIRREKDKRTYIGIFNRRKSSEIFLHIRAMVSTKIAENKVDCFFEKNYFNKINTIYYKGLNGYFKDFDERYTKEFTEYLVDRTKNRGELKKELNKIKVSDIAVHIRRGDFSHISTDHANNGMNFLIDDEWYVKAVKEVKKITPDGRVRVFTDEAELSKEFLTDLDCYEVDDSNNALHSILKMSTHGYLIASKSSFSLWSSYLGRQYTVVNQDFDIEMYMPKGLIKIKKI